MSFLNKIFQSIPVKIPDRSGFDLSHEVLSTAKVGTVVPVTHIEVMPGDTISMGSMMKVTLPPMAVPFMGRIDAELTAAFIPFRLLWNGWQAFITQNNGTNPGAVTPTSHGDSASDPSAGIDTPINYLNVPITTPLIDMDEQRYVDSQGNPDMATVQRFCGAGSLADYLGYKRENSAVPLIGSRTLSALPFLAYHKFCDDWIRDENNMKPFYPKINTGSFNYQGGNVTAPLAYFCHPGLLPFDAQGGYTVAAGLSTISMFPNQLPIETSPAIVDSNPEFPVSTRYCLGDLRQRCWAKDYFTTATTRPQAGAASSVIFDTSGSTGSITVSSLRAASQLQKWMERNNIAGTDYGSIMQAHFGVRPPDAVLQRSVLLGSVRTPVYVGSVENNTGTAGVSGGAPTGTKSPFGNTLGAAAGFASAADKGTLVEDFTAKEHGIIMVFFTLIPHAYYNTGIDRQLLHTGVGDFAWPEFASIGDQEIRRCELTAAGSLNRNAVFGYNQRYSEYKFRGDRISGLLRDGENMAVYALQRGFSSVPSLGANFLEIPTDFLDQVFGVDASVSGFGCMVDAYFDCRALRTLPEYSLPSL